MFNRYQNGVPFAHKVEPGIDLDPAIFKQSYFLTNMRPVSPESASQFKRVIHSLDEIEEAAISGATFFVAFECDSDAIDPLNRIIKAGGRFLAPTIFGKTSYRFANRLAFEAMKKTWDKASRLSHLTPEVHENVCEALELTRNVEGDYVEIGVYKGGSALTAMNYMDLQRREGAPERKAWLLDTFDGFTYEAAQKSADRGWVGSLRLWGVEETKKYLAETFCDVETPYELIASDICADNIPQGLKKASVVNVDVDLFDATAAGLAKFAPVVSPGGVMVCEDPTCTPGLYGAYIAMKLFLDSPAGQEFTPIFKTGGYLLLKNKK
jgi:hypothetical protein